MKILGYGEDALTFWAITRKLSEILASAGDESPINSVTVLFRPSFGRRGGPVSSQFGEFDFVIATPTALHLGETKLQSSPEATRDLVVLHPRQIERHRIFAVYYAVWVSEMEWDWQSYLQRCQARFLELGIQKPVPPAGSLLSRNLQNILRLLSAATSGAPTVRDILLVIKTGVVRSHLQWQPPQGFMLVELDASDELVNGFLWMQT